MRGRSSPAVGGPVLWLCLGLTACAGRETQAARDAWERATNTSKANQADANKQGRGDRNNANTNAGTWDRLVNFASETADMLALGVSTAPLEMLVERLCAEKPDEAEFPEDAATVRCAPKPALEPLGHKLTLELSNRGLVGMVAVDLSDQDSALLLAEALKQVGRSCARGWAKVPSQADNAHEEFHTCLTASGSLLALGRFPSDAAISRWQFSLAVLGPG